MKRLLAFALVALGAAIALPSCTTVVEDRDPAPAVSTTTTESSVVRTPVSTSTTTTRTQGNY